MSEEVKKPNQNMAPRSDAPPAPRAADTLPPIVIKSPPPAKPSESQLPAEEEPIAPAEPGKESKRGAIIVLILIGLSLVWYFVSDRLTPYTSQARVQAFVVPVAGEVSGTVRKVHVKNNDEVQRGQPLFDIDPTQYKIALQRSLSDYESVRLSVGASTASVDAAKAAVQAAVANYVYAQQDATRLEQIYKEDPGALSVRRVESAQANRIKARSQVEGESGPEARAGDRGRARRRERAIAQCARSNRKSRARSKAHRRGGACAWHGH